MSTKKKIDLNSEKVSVVYSNWLAQLAGLIKTRILILILGRGAGKTNDFLTERLIDIAYDMP